MFRSQNMSLNRVMFAKESMWDTMNYLASCQKIMMHLQEENLTKHGKQNSLALYGEKTNKRCEELLMEIQETEEKMKFFEWPITDSTKFLREHMVEIDKYCEKQQIHGQRFYDQQEKEMSRLLKQLKEHLNIYESILDQRIDLIEQSYSLGLMEEIIPYHILDQEYGSRISSQVKLDNEKKIQSIIGLVPTKNILKVQKILFRISRGNLIMKYRNLPLIKDNLLKGKMIEEKTLIFLIIPRTEQEVMIQQIRLCLEQNEFKEQEMIHPKMKNETLLHNKMNFDENRTILNKTKNKINDIFEQFASSSILQDVSNIEFFKFLVQREQCFAKHLLFIEEKDGFNQLLFWTTEEFRPTLEEEISAIKSQDVHFIPPKIVEIKNTKLIPPTQFNLNPIISTFQLIVNTYGIPRYKECNPGLFTIISFPFLFGLMFGDIGHGLCVTIFGFLMILYQQDKRSMLYSVKYMIFMMGLFSLYCGFIYNEFFSVPLVFQKSCYEKLDDKFVIKSPGCVYPFGTDYVWYQSANETAFINSFKMKFSIIVGVLQMLFGIILKGMNSLYFNSYLDFFFEAIPQFIFLTITFGYMSFLIIVKWLTDFNGVQNPVSIISIFINFFTVDQPLIGSGDFQQNLQIVFSILCLLCIFWMLLPKPIILILGKKDHKPIENTSIENEYQETLIDSKDNTSGHQDEGNSEIIVHQLIETIEFVLGSISNTASYLRLWALSLAHGQLAKVFLDLIFKWAITDAENIFISFISIIFGFIFFAIFTLSVILVMDFMECFLHGLRLHWVEFQNKFFKGDGKLFEPFNYQIQQN